MAGDKPPRYKEEGKDRIRHSRECSPPCGGTESILSALERPHTERGTSPRATGSNCKPVNRHDFTRAHAFDAKASEVICEQT